MGYLAPTAACKLMHQDMGDLGLDVRNLDLLMKTGFGILAPQRLAVGALFRESLDRHLWWEGSVARAFHGSVDRWSFS